MTIRKSLKDGICVYEVYVSCRSKKTKKRIQKRKGGFKSLAHAKRTEKLLLEECFKEIQSIDNKGFLWGEIVNQWGKFKKDDRYDPLHELTLIDYMSALRKWTQPLWDKIAREVNKSDVRNVLATIEAAGKSKSFQSKMKHNINTVFNWGMENALIKNVASSPTYGIKINRSEDKVPEILNLVEIKRLLENAKRLDHDWYPVWATAILSGCRSGELYALQWDDVCFETNNIKVSKSYNCRLRTIKSTKANYWRNVPINAELRKLFMELKAEKREHDFVLPRLQDWKKGNQARILKTFCRSIGITPIKFHTLRACFATLLLQNNVAPATVMKVCGWRDLSTMATYIRMAGIDESGATDSLNVLTPREASAKILELLN